MEQEYCFKSGTIKYMKLSNFMCHEAFEIYFGPRVNFVIGPNGSGKSALLTALMVALGGRATTTSRAKRVDDFVMYGKKSAKITVVLHNYEKIMEKNQAFKPDDYGKSVTIEKSIYKDEVSRLCLKNDKGKKVSERKQELDEMLDHFGILINNPICILNQEVSKTFLHSKKPEDKFDLFMKATNLEQIEQDYLSANQSHKSWDESNSKQSVIFRLLDAEYNSCKEKTDFLENRAKLTDKRQALTEEMVWAIARDNENLSDEINRKVQAIDDDIEKAKQAISSSQNKVLRYTEDIDILKTKLQSLNQQFEETRKKVSDVRNKETNVKTKQMEYKLKIDQSNSRIKRFQNDKLSVEKSITEMKSQFNDQNSLDQENEIRKLEIEKLEREVPAEIAREKSIRLHTSQLSTSMAAIRTELHAANTRTIALKGKMSEQESNLRRLKMGQEDTLRRFGDHIVKLREEIDRAHSMGKFKKKPVGPVGYYLKLKNPEVAAALEACLGRGAYAFVCDNHQDWQVLRSLCNRVTMNTRQLKPTMIQRQFGPRHNVSQAKAVHPTHKTLLDYLEIENDVAYNVMVDKHFLEGVLYIPDYTDAENLMLDPKLVPANTKCAYTSDSSVMYPRTAQGGYRSFAGKPDKCILFARSNQDRIKRIERELELTKADLRDAENIVKGIQESLNVQRQEYDNNIKERNNIINDIRKKEERLLNLKTTVIVEPQELSALEAELETIGVRIVEEQKTIEKCKEQMSGLARELADIVRERNELQEIFKAREAERQGVLRIMEETKASMLDTQTKIKQQDLIIINRQKDKIEHQKKLDDALEKLARSTQNIPSDRTRPSQIRKTDEVKQELQKVEAQLRVEMEEERDPAELMESLRKRMKEIESLTALKDFNLRNFASSSKTLEERREGFSRLRSLTTSAVSTTFSTVMRSMKMNGELKIHLDDVVHNGELVKKAKTLEMRIDTNYTPSQRVVSVMNDNNNQMNDSRRSVSQPADQPSRPKRARIVPAGADGEKENAIKMTDARSLSGGERSFSTVAFVLALWHHCASPFKLMDEIDVFMDMVTRRVSYNALIRFAQCTDDPGQFIFFSPLELPKFDDSGTFVRVFEMPAIIRKRPYSQIQMGDGGDDSRQVQV